MPSFIQRLQHGWNAFRGRDRPDNIDYGAGSYSNPMRRQYLRRGSERSIITAIYNRIAMDVASHKIEHVRLDVNDEFYVETIRDSLNNCLTLEANIDQTSRAFFQDAVFSLFDEGNIAIVPTDADLDPTVNGSYNIQSMRVAKISQWYPKYVTVDVYDEGTGLIRQRTYPKTAVAIIENPFYSVMNEPNSILQRLIRKLNLLDIVDEETSSGKLNLIIQLPYVVKSTARKQQAEQRRKEVEMQLTENKYGIAYTDGTEKITQLSRPIENNLMSQIEYLMNTLYSQLGITPEILNGTASEEVMLNYNTRTVEPILAAIVDELKRKFLTKTARTQGQSIMYSSEPFKLVPTSKLADLAEKFTGNGILNPNEFRQIIGFKPSDDPNADVLGNQRINPQGDLGSNVPIDSVGGEVSPTFDQNGSNSSETQDYADTGGSDNIADMPISVLNELMKKSGRS